MPLTPVQLLLVVGVGVESMFAQANFSGTVTLGSILLGIIVLVVAGLFTIRSNVASVWRQEAEGFKSRAEDLQQKLDEEKEVRHALKNDLATANAQLLIEKGKPDLSLIIEMSKENYAMAMRDVTRMFDGVVATQTQMLGVLTRLTERIESDQQ